MVGRAVAALAVCAWLAAAAAAEAAAGGEQPALVGRGFNFFRRAVDSRFEHGRRAFGGAPAGLHEYPYACALLDVGGAPACSCSVLRARWALTAAHCLTADNAAYVNYNAERAGVGLGDVAVVHYHYRHPGYKVEWSDTGRGMEVSTLHHDVGLVRTRTAMPLHYSVPREPDEFARYKPAQLRDLIVRAYGFGAAGRASRPEPAVTVSAAPGAPVAGIPSEGGERLQSVDLRLTACGREAWYHVACGAAVALGAGGACSGDSGGPVVYRGVQLAVTSMGPLECAAGGAGGATTAVFTTLYNYYAVINSTITEKEQEEQMERLRMMRMRASTGSPAALAPSAIATAATGSLLLLLRTQALSLQS